MYCTVNVFFQLFHVGMGGMPWTINSEIYPVHARNFGIAVSTATNWLCNLIVTVSFLCLLESMPKYGNSINPSNYRSVEYLDRTWDFFSGIFWIYTGVAFLGALFVFFMVPETKGRNLEEVEGLFATPWTDGAAAVLPTEKPVQYVHIRGLNRDGRGLSIDSDSDWPPLSLFFTKKIKSHHYVIKDSSTTFLQREKTMASQKMALQKWRLEELKRSQTMRNAQRFHGYQPKEQKSLQIWMWPMHTDKSICRADWCQQIKPEKRADTLKHVPWLGFCKSDVSQVTRCCSKFTVRYGEEETVQPHTYEWILFWNFAHAEEKKREGISAVLSLHDDSPPRRQQSYATTVLRDDNSPTRPQSYTTTVLHDHSPTRRQQSYATIFGFSEMSFRGASI